MLPVLQWPMGIQPERCTRTLLRITQPPNIQSMTTPTLGSKLCKALSPLHPSLIKINCSSPPQKKNWVHPFGYFWKLHLVLKCSNITPKQWFCSAIELAMLQVKLSVRGHDSPCPHSLFHLSPHVPVLYPPLHWPMWLPISPALFVNTPQPRPLAKPLAQSTCQPGDQLWASVVLWLLVARTRVPLFLVWLLLLLLSLQMQMTFWSTG